MTKIIKKHAVLIGVVISLICLVTAILLYPGGSMFDKNSIGFNWSTTFISNLFGAKALNGSDNPSRIWAYTAMLLLPVSYAIFFANLSKKIPDKNAAIMLKYGGLANVLCMFLIVTPLHDLMLNISISLFWTCMFIVTVLIFKTKLHLFKFLCVVCLAVFYYSIYLWATNKWNVLPTMQKLNFINSTIIILLLEYFTKQEDFAQIKSKKQLNFLK